MKHILWPSLLILALFLNACSQKNKNTEPAEIFRYEQDLFQVNTENLKPELLELQKTYPVFLGGDLNDTLNLIQIYDYLTDPSIIALYNETREKYPTLEYQEYELGNLKNNYHTIFPEEEDFQIFTYISGLDFENPAVFINNMLLVALDMYLGPGYEEYDRIGVPRYVSRRFVEENIIRDAAEAVARSKVMPPSNNTLVAEFIAEGKVMFLMHHLHPETPKHLILNYTEEQYRWCEKHEKELWTFMLKNDFLFSSDTRLKRDYLLEAPSTPEFGEEAPARLGQFLGWQILKSYYKKNSGSSIAQIIETQDAESILNNAGYRP